MASSSTSYVQKSFRYDVFLSFRGEDIRKTFVDHLYHALEQKGIYTYKDDEKIKKGERIDDQLMRSIEDSKFYIVVFSKNYTSSSWCLEELVKIMECQRMTEHTAYIVFYDVEPTEIRKQIGYVGEAFSKFKNEKTVGKWRAALQEAAGLAGWELKSTANGHEAKLIQKIVEEISPKLLCNNLSIDGKLVGMKTRVNEVVLSLHTDTNDVRMIGIKGMGGGGKTTLARVVFDQISNWFEGSSFVENVREVSNDSSKGLKSLQQQVLSDVLNDPGISVTGVSDGKVKMKRMLRHIKVLVVLDDVDCMEQLEALAGELNWFKPGSRILITTREEKVLVAHGVNVILNVNLLSDKEAICLFSRYAFGKEFPVQGYKELSKKVVCYAAGLPLTIKVLGSFLNGESDDVWRDALERLQTIPLKETLETLELSYIGLQYDYKEIFLNVACILKGWEKDEAIRALESCGYHAKNGLNVLEKKSLITVSNHGYLGMHDHIAEMGRHIVRRLHPDEPCKHSRLWNEEETEDLLTKGLGTEATRYICLSNMKLHPAIVMKGLGNMKELIFLYMDGSFRYYKNFDEDSKCLPNALRFICWYRYPFTSLPQKFQANNLVGLQMQHSSIIQLWECGERKVLKKLKFIDLSNSDLRTLDLELVPNLEILFLRACTHLEELDVRFTCQKLKFLDLSYSHIRTLYLGLTQDLEKLNLKACKDLVELDMRGGSPKLKFLCLSQSKLRIIYLGWSPNLERLSLENCDDLEELHMPVGSVKLKSFELSCPNLRILDLSQTSNLERLNIRGYWKLVELHLPVELKSFYLIHSKLRTLDLSRISNLETVSLHECYDLIELRMPRVSPMLKSLNLSLSKLKFLHLWSSPNLQELSLQGCDDLKELRMSIGSLKPKSFKLFWSKMKILDLHHTRNLESLDLEECEDLVKLHVPVELKSLYLNCSKLQILDLARNTNLETLSLKGCCELVELHMPVQSLKLKSRQLCASELRTVELARSILNLKNCRNLECNFCGLGFLRTLTLEGIFLEIPKDLNQFEFLEELKISSSETHLPNSTCMLKRLRVLRLNCSDLEDLPEDLGRLECLEELCLSSGKIKHLPNSTCMLKRLRVLRLDCSYLLEDLPEDLGRLECLEELCLSSTKIKHLPNSTCMLKRLRVLRLNCSDLEDLPEDLGRLECLEELCLSSGKIKHLPNSTCMLKRLRVLRLDCSFLLEDLPEDLGRLECLEELCLSFGKIKHLPNSTCMLKRLRVLRLDCSYFLEDLPEDLGRLECLEELCLSSTKIKHLPNSTSMLKRLRVLRLNCSILLEDLPEDLGRLECLEELCLSSTKIKHLPNSTCMLKRLRVLRLNGSYLLEELPEDLGRLECLEELAVSSEMIKHLPNSICMLKHLKILRPDDCFLHGGLHVDLGRVAFRVASHFIRND